MPFPVSSPVPGDRSLAASVERVWPLLSSALVESRDTMHVERDQPVCGAHTQCKSHVSCVAVCALSPLRDACLCECSLGFRPLCCCGRLGGSQFGLLVSVCRAGGERGPRGLR